MRTIKFRGKRIDGGGWITGYYVKELNPYIKDTEEIDAIITKAGDYEVIPESVGQWTGLVDRHGKEIFEGDVLRYSDGEILAVEFDNRTAQFTAKTRWLWTIIDVCEIIGNIHDNPELMEVE